MNKHSRASFITSFPLFRDFLDCKSYCSVILSSKGIQSLYDDEEGGTASSSAKEFVKRFPTVAAMIGKGPGKTDGGMNNALCLVKNYISFHESCKSIFERVGQSISLRVDLIFEVSEYLERFFEWETYHYIVDNSATIVVPSLVSVVVQFARRKVEAEMKDDSAEYMEPEPLSLTLHEYRWGAHNPIGFRARDIEVITNFSLSSRGTKFYRQNGHYWERYESVGDENLYDKLENMWKKSKSTSLMQCLTPSVIWVGGHRRVDIATRGP